MSRRGIGGLWPLLLAPIPARETPPVAGNAQNSFTNTIMAAVPGQLERTTGIAPGEPAALQPRHCFGFGRSFPLEISPPTCTPDPSPD